MSYQHCGYPNMSIRKFKEMYPELKVTKEFGKYHYTISSKNSDDVINLNLEAEWYRFTNKYYTEEFIDDVRLLYKYLKKEMKNTEIYSKKGKKDDKRRISE